jgi:hypothetical protein
MKRRVEFLVEKRDGRTEWLRSTKLARSIHQALQSAGVDEDWRALALATAVLAGLRQRRASQAAAGTRLPILSTHELADTVLQVLVATGQPLAAAAYGAVGAERARRALASGRTALLEGPVLPAASRRFRQE